MKRIVLCIFIFSLFPLLNYGQTPTLPFYLSLDNHSIATIDQKGNVENIMEEPNLSCITEVFGHSIYYYTNDNNGDNKFWRYDLNTHTHTLLLDKPDSYYSNKDDNYIYFSSQHPDTNKVTCYAFKKDSNQIAKQTVLNIPSTQLTNASRIQVTYVDGNYFYYTIESNTPPLQYTSYRMKDNKTSEKIADGLIRILYKDKNVFFYKLLTSLSGPVGLYKSDLNFTKPICIAEDIASVRIQNQTLYYLESAVSERTLYSMPLDQITPQKVITGLIHPYFISTNDKVYYLDTTRCDNPIYDIMAPSDHYVYPNTGNYTLTGDLYEYDLKTKKNTLLLKAPISALYEMPLLH